MASWQVGVGLVFLGLMLELTNKYRAKQERQALLLLRAQRDGEGEGEGERGSSDKKRD